MANRKPSVLVVDDDPAVLTTYGMILERHGYDVSTAISSIKALEYVSKKNFDFLVCDYSLEQEHTGFEVVDAARAKDANVPAMLITGYATLETADQAKQKNIAVLYKPIDIQELFNTLTALLRTTNAQGCKEKDPGKTAKKDASSETGTEQSKPAGRARRSSAASGFAEK